MKDEIRKDIIEIVSNLTEIPKEQIKPDVSFRDAGMDSFALVEIVFAIENKFDINIPQDGLIGIKTINEMVDLVEKLLGQK